jgi:hypothetical protein
MAKYLSFPLAKAKHILSVLLKTSEGTERDYIRGIMSRARENTTKGLAPKGRLLLNERDGTWLRSRGSFFAGGKAEDTARWTEKTPSKRGKIVETTRPDDGAPTTIRSMGQRDFDAIARDSALRQERAAAKSGRKLNRTGKVTRRSLEEDTF